MELLVVIAIITILAGLTIAVLSQANQTSGAHRARGEIAALETALEAYKTENGDYPRCNNTDTLDASRNDSTNSVVISGGVPSLSGSASMTLYVNLSGDKTRLGTKNPNERVYFTFKSNMLYPRVPAGETRSSPIQAVIDPFRNVYGYSTRGSSVAAVSNTSTTTSFGYNPTFDLWSTVGSDSTSAWVTNW